MCYFVAINLPREELHKRFGAEVPVDWRWEPQPFISGFTFPELPVIMGAQPENFIPARWGLIPFWVQDDEKAREIRGHTLNAQAETVHQKPSFRKAFSAGRCLVPVNGYFEWHHQGKDKFPFYITLPERAPFALAGITDDWVNKQTGEIIRTFSIVTTPANHLLSRVHNSKKRMPAVLEPDDEKIWMDKNTSPLQALSLLKPCTEEKLIAFPIARLNPSLATGILPNDLTNPVEYSNLVW